MNMSLFKPSYSSSLMALLFYSTFHSPVTSQKIKNTKPTAFLSTGKGLLTPSKSADTEPFCVLINSLLNQREKKEKPGLISTMRWPRLNGMERNGGQKPISVSRRQPALYLYVLNSRAVRTAGTVIHHKQSGFCQ